MDGPTPYLNDNGSDNAGTCHADAPGTSGHLIRLRHMRLGVLCDGSLADMGTVDESAYRVLAPLRGRITVTCDGVTATIECGAAAIIPPRKPLTVTSSDDSRTGVLWISADALERELANIAGGRRSGVITRMSLVDLTNGRGRAWWRAATHFLEDIDRPVGLLTTAAAGGKAEEVLLRGLLMLHSEVSRTVAAKPDQSAMESSTWDAEALMRRDPTQSISFYAREAGVTVRTLQRGYRDVIECTPSEYRDGIRLRRIYDELRTSSPDEVSVVGVARKWGFANSKYFQTRYFKQFGEAPSETLQRYPGGS